MILGDEVRYAAEEGGGNEAEGGGDRNGHNQAGAVQEVIGKVLEKRSYGPLKESRAIRNLM